MKKLCVKYALCSILGVITTYAVLSIWWFNSIVLIKFDCEEKTILHYLLSIITNALFILAFKYISKKDIKKLFNDENNEDNIPKKGSKKCESLRRLFLIINSVIYFILIISFYHYGLYVVSDIVYGINISSSIIDVLLSIIFTILSLLPSVILINTIFKNKKYNYSIIFKIIRVGKYSFVALSIVVLFFINIFYYIPANEFKFVYKYCSADDFEGYYNNDFSGFAITDFQDIRDLKKENIVIPSKLWGKLVVGFDFNILEDTKTIILPNSLKFECLKESSIRTARSILDSLIYASPACCEIKMQGEPIDWHIKDNIIYDIDDRNMIIVLEIQSDVLYIGSKIERIYPGTFVQFIPSDTKVTIDENNPYFYEYGNVIWTKNSSATIRGPMAQYQFFNNWDLALIKTGFREYDKSIDIKISPNVNKPILLSWPIVSNIDKIIIPQDFLYDDFQYINSPYAHVYCNSYEVEEGNPIYATYQGNLYNKDLTKLYAIRKYNYDEDFIVPDSLNEISKTAISQIDYTDLNIKTSGDLIYENGNLYTKGYEKLLLNRSKDNEEIIFKKNTSSISDGLIEYENDGYNNERNAYRYCIENESGEIEKNHMMAFDNANEENVLTIISCSKEVVKIDDNISEIDERLYERLCFNSIEVESGNQFFEAENGALYSKGKEKIISVYNHGGRYSKSFDDIVKLYLMTSYISPQALTSLVGYNIECDANNPYYEVYKGNLYTKGRKELLCFGKVVDNEIIIAKETSHISEESLEAFVNYYIYSDKNDFKITVEDGNEEYGVYEGNLYKDNFSTIVLLSYIKEFASDTKVFKIHPECKHFTRSTFLCCEQIEFLNFDVSGNKYIKSIYDTINYYPEYSYLNLDAVSGDI